jgi:hypothetical protein
VGLREVLNRLPEPGTPSQDLEAIQASLNDLTEATRQLQENQVGNNFILCDCTINDPCLTSGAVCLSLSLSLCVCVCVCVGVCVCVFACVFMCALSYDCTCMCMCVCVPAAHRHNSGTQVSLCLCSISDTDAAEALLQTVISEREPSPSRMGLDRETLEAALRPLEEAIQGLRDRSGADAASVPNDDKANRRLRQMEARLLEEGREAQEKLLMKLRGEENGLSRQLDELASRLEAKMEARLSGLESALRERGMRGPMGPMCTFTCV